MKRILAGALLATTLLFAACGSDDDDTPAPASDGGSDAAPGKDGAAGKDGATGNDATSGDAGTPIDAMTDGATTDGAAADSGMADGGTDADAAIPDSGAPDGEAPIAFDPEDPLGVVSPPARDGTGAITGIVELALGTDIACARFADGSVHCAGSGPDVGYGDGDGRAVFPNAGVPLVEKAKQVVAASSGACALLSSGAVKCWGSVTSGQTGDGTTDPRITPTTKVELDSPAKQIAMGDIFACAILKNGKVRCWGSNSFGSLGYGDKTNRLKPETYSIALSQPAIELTAYQYAVCARLADESATCWGDGGSGHLGNNSPFGNQLAPPAAPIALGQPAKEIHLGSSHGCARLADGSVKCWGSNSNGELGSGIARNAPTNETVPLGQNATSIAAGYAHTCASLTDGTVKCWGARNLTNDIFNHTIAPETIAGITGVVRVVAGYRATCGLTATGSAKCWGYNLALPLALGPDTNRFAPSPPIVLPMPATQVSAGYNHACTRLTDGQVYCWGDGRFGALGNGTASTTANPSIGTPAATTALGQPALDATAGFLMTCARLADKTVKCWGDNRLGQLGLGDKIQRNSPPAVPIAVGGPVAQVVIGNQFACTLLESGDAKCWGLNNSGQLGAGDTADRISPPATGVVLGQAATKLAAGYSHVCAILADKTVRCWGSGPYIASGDLLGHSTPQPPLSLGQGAIDIAAGDQGTCVTLVDNSVKCWGHGALGYGDTSPHEMPTSALTLPGSPIGLAVSASHECALLSTKEVTCWGNNALGELGLGTLHRLLTPAATPLSLANVSQIAAGQSFTLAVMANGDVRAWGKNQEQELGDGSARSDYVSTPKSMLAEP